MWMNMRKRKEIQAREFPLEEHAVTEEKNKLFGDTAVRCVTI